MTSAPEVDIPDNRTVQVKRSADGLCYHFDFYCVQGNKLFDLMAGVPMTQVSDRGYHAHLTLPAQIVAEMFAGVTEAAMTSTDAEEAADRILVPATA